MRKSLIEKSSDGSYNFTEFGLYSTHVLAIKQLVFFYLRKVIKLDNVKAKEKLKGLESFIYKNFTKVEEFISKITSISSSYLEETNSQRFIQFASQEFITTLEDVKKKMYEKELALFQEQFNHSQLSSGERFLKKLGELFLSSEALNWKKHLMQKENEKLEKTRKEATVQVDNEILGRLPGERLLEKFRLLFQFSRKINEKFQSHSKIDKDASFTSFVFLERKVRTYQVSKDAAGYKTWLSKLSNYQMATLLLLLELKKEKKGASILWRDYYLRLSQKVKLELPLLSELKINVQVYWGLFDYLQDIFRFIKSEVSDVKLLQRLYQDLVKISNDGIDVSSKKQGIEFSLLPITDESIRKKAHLKISTFLDNLIKFYL